MAAKRPQDDSASSSSSAPPRWSYDACLSFRDEDTRKTFTDHLYATLLWFKLEFTPSGMMMNSQEDESFLRSC
ncbi:hypothetical protein CsSME_00034132 [Camellia sinensis var. sinensis]